MEESIRKLPARHQILDHGVEYEQYFQGCGTSFTDYTDVYTGIGDSAKEALEDALEQAATCGWDVDSIENNESNALDVTEGADECHHYVSIRLA